MTTSQLCAFCKAVYIKQQPLSSQPKFLKVLFESAGATWSYRDDYGCKLFNGSKELTSDLCDTLPETIDTAKVTDFLRKYLTDTTGKKSDLSSRCTKVATEAGLPTNLTIDPEAFIPALGDWFQAIIKNPTDCDILATAYQRGLEGEDNPDPKSFPPLYAGDNVIVSRPPSQQSHSVPFWGGFSHEWALQNTGAITWSRRKLHCVNPTDNGVRPATDEIPVPDTAPQGFAKIAINFDAHAHEGHTASRWQMVNAQEENCFPDHSKIFDVAVDVVNPNAAGSEAR